MHKLCRDPSKKFEYEARRKAILDQYSLIRDAELREKRVAVPSLGSNPHKQGGPYMTTKLVQPVAIRLELIRSSGFSISDILTHLKNADLTPFHHINGGEVDFSILLEYAQTNWEAFEQALTQGYQATFLTVPGVKNFLAARYNLQAGRDYEDQGESFENLKLPADEVQWLTSTLSQNWAVQQTGDTLRIHMVR